MNNLSNEILHTPEYYILNLNGIQTFIDSEGPNWISTDDVGAKILSLVDGKRTFDEIVKIYSTDTNLPLSKAWVHADVFIKDSIREKFVSLTPFSRSPYKGRNQYLKLNYLRELWIHTNNSCNLKCTHCLVNSSPSGDKGLDSDTLKKLVSDGKNLGVERFYLTGGEPFLRKDIFDLIQYITGDRNTELIILTNGMFFNHKNNMDKLIKVSSVRLKPQISLDGSTSESNDAIRGKGTFNKIINGIKIAVENGLDPTITTVVNSDNIEDIPDITRLAHNLGVKNHHLLWVHQRGRISEDANHMIVPVYKLIEVVKKTKNIADDLGIKIDNFESIKSKLKSRKFTKFDLSNAAWESLCVYSDGQVYPSAAFADYHGLSAGNIKEQTLENIWKSSRIFKQFRNATVQNKAKCSTCYLKYICGGGDIEHTFFYTASINGTGNIEGLDPYCELHEYIIQSSLYELAQESFNKINRVSGFDSPIVFKSMGDEILHYNQNYLTKITSSKNTINNNQDFNIEVSHSNCVLTYTLDRPREAVRNFYSNAAEQPQKNLCCPVSYPIEDTAHIPSDVIERFYGCGSPVSIAEIKPAETVVDLGSGAGIDCFIASKKTGRNGYVIGIDMTDNMLEIANKYKSDVIEKLGYNNIEFKKGFLEQIPVDHCTADLITSNCVINLSPDKKVVFSEMWRILKDHGRIVISDIISEQEVPSHIVTNKQLLGECIAGALTEEQFISYLEQAGFYGLTILNKTYWKTIENYKFYSLTVRGFKFEKKAGCIYSGQKAIYLGPFKATYDEEGHLFPRGEAVEICSDTAFKLTKPPYNSYFIVTDTTLEYSEEFNCRNNTSACC